MRGVLLAGGPLGQLPREAGDGATSKGMLLLGGRPLAWRALQALRQSRTVQERILVGGQPDWAGVDRWLEAGPSLIDSFAAGVQACAPSDEPVLVCCGDLPFLTREAIDDFVGRCRRRPDAALWYGYLRQENSQRRYPRVRHTWARLQDGTFCGTGVMMLRPSVLRSMKQTMEHLTRIRKSLLGLAQWLGWFNLLRYGLGRLTVVDAERAACRIFGVDCQAVESPYAELGLNLDCPEDLEEARRILLEDGDPLCLTP